MELSESFLLGWAVGATIAAGYFQHQYRKAMRGGVILCVILEAIAQGKAKLVDDGKGKLSVDMGDHTVTLREIS
jgi:hypothetical protein